MYTCPSGETAIIKQVSGRNPGALAAALVLRLNGNVGANGVFSLTIAAGAITQTGELFYVLGPGDTLHAAASTGTIDTAGFGAELEGVAD